MKSHLVGIKRFDTTLPLPEYKTGGAAAIDLYARETTVIPARGIGYVPLNIALQLPENTWALLAARSSLHKKGLMLANGIGVGDYDYRGDGASSEFNIDPDLFIYPQFITDLNAVLDHLRKSRAITKFDLFGMNIGAGLSIGVGANRTETKKIIADGPWTSLEGMKAKIKAKTGKDVNMPFGYDKTHEPLYAFEKPKGPMKNMMIIVSPQDPIVGPADVKVIKGVNEVYIVKNSPSNADNFSTDKNTYFERISKFLAVK